MRINDPPATYMEFEIVTNAIDTWIGIGFPPRSNYYNEFYDRMVGYAIVIEGNENNRTATEYNMEAISCTPFPSCYFLTTSQHIIDFDETTVGDVLTIHFKRLLNTNDANDARWDLNDFLNCEALLVTANLGRSSSSYIIGGVTAFASHEHLESFMYFYNEEKESTDTLFQTQNHIVTGGTTAQHVYINVSIPVGSDRVYVDVEWQNTGAGYTGRWFGITWPDVDLKSKYNFASFGAYLMKSNFAVMFFADYTDYNDNIGCTFLSDGYTPLPARQASILDPRTDSCSQTTNACIEFHSDQSFDMKYSSLLSTGVSQYYHFEVPIESCGHTFNKFEYTTCRPWTITTAINTQSCRGRKGSSNDHYAGYQQVQYFNTHNPTIASTTLSPPITHNPTTNDPTTYNPTTNKPTTHNPTTNNPTTHDPTTNNPTTRNPTTNDPTTTSPTTNGPTTNIPTTNDPTTQLPSVAPTPFPGILKVQPNTVNNYVSVYL
eukprot:407714_1